jgi:mono/diheme cytochrome c family protein
MRVGVRPYLLVVAISAVVMTFSASMLMAQDANFHNAPASSHQSKNPSAGQPAAVAAGSRLYATNCGSCHGAGGVGTGNIPALSGGPAQSATDGEVFWFITTGAVDAGMPSWSSLPARQRWQIVAYLKSLKRPS